jgi:hypothetical protein
MLKVDKLLDLPRYGTAIFVSCTFLRIGIDGMRHYLPSHDSEAAIGQICGDPLLVPHCSTMAIGKALYFS